MKTYLSSVAILWTFRLEYSDANTKSPNVLNG